MPIIKSAKKKMRQDKVREARNSKVETNIKRLVKDMRQNPTAKLLQEVTSHLDKAVKTKLLHANKASRIKSRLSKLLGTKSSTAGIKKQSIAPKKTTKAPVKKSAKK